MLQWILAVPTVQPWLRVRRSTSPYLDFNPTLKPCPDPNEQQIGYLKWVLIAGKLNYIQSQIIVQAGLTGLFTIRSPDNYHLC